LIDLGPSFGNVHHKTAFTAVFYDLIVRMLPSVVDMINGTAAKIGCGLAQIMILI